jgi:hypothetical protein
MDLAVTVSTAAVKVVVRVRSVPQPVGAIVTLVAEPRHPHLEQALVDRAVRVVAVGTIIENRRMLKEKRASSLCMTGVTVLVHAGLYEL